MTDSLETARSSPVTTGSITAIASGKGGVGKTWFAITLAHALARLGRRVLLFDGDLGLANVDIQLGLMPERDLAGFTAGHRTIAETVIRYGDGNFDIIAGRSGSAALSALDPTMLDRVLSELRGLSSAYDDVLLDLGAGLERAVRKMAAFADVLLVLATDEPTSLTDAYAVLKLYTSDKTGGSARIVVNQAATRAAGERTYSTLRRACASFLGREPALAGIIRRDDRVRDAIRRQTLLLTRYPTTAASLDVEAIAAALGKR